MHTTKTTCPYCGVGCGVLVLKDADGHIRVKPDPEHPANLGRLCSKGTALADTLEHPQRLLYPEINDQRVSWDTAITTIASRFQQIIDEHGREAIAFYVSGQLLTEDYYVANKFMKGCIGSANIDTNSRLCMSSAVAAHKRAFGEDLVPCSYEDLEQAELLILVGSNTAWCHPVLYQRMLKTKQANPALKVITIDPRRTQTADIADLHLGLAPGTDTVLFNGLLAYLDRNGYTDHEFVAYHTEGSKQAVTTAQLSAANVQVVADHCQLDVEDVRRFFDWFATTPKVITVFSQGINQSSSGVDKGNAIINCHLLTGRIGKPGMGPFSFTGQPNAMGGREVGGLANQLAAHLDIDEPEHRALLQRFWQSPSMAPKAGLKAVDLFAAMAEGKIKAVWIMATNPLVSLPDTAKVRRALETCELVIVSDCVRHTDTQELAHIRLPALTWGERDGTVTNSERCISRQRPFLSAPAEAQQDWQILTAVAHKMGFAPQFPYQNAYDIFREHVALSAFANEGERCFNLQGWQELSADEYEQLSPTRWPVMTKQQGTTRLFTDGKFFTPTGKARFIATKPQAPQSARTLQYPFVLNTGRIRDQWHTMTRTGFSPRLSAHIAEPYVEMHPCDARDQGLKDGKLARVHNALGSVLLRVKTTHAQQRGSLFAPIHWNRQFASSGSISQLVPAITDSISGQPESKHATVTLEPIVWQWQGFLISRRKLALPTDYWVGSRIAHGWLYTLAHNQIVTDWQSFARDFLCTETTESNWIEYADVSRNTYRAARFQGSKLESCLFTSASAPLLPHQDWLISLFAQEQLTAIDRAALLTGKPAVPTEDKGRTVCACFEVGEKTIRKLITEQGIDSVEGIGQCVQAGTNCGSCLPELKVLLADR